MNKLQISKLLSAVDVYYKTAQVKDPQNAENLTNSRIQSVNAINTKQLTFDQVKEYANEQQLAAHRDFQAGLISRDQYTQVVKATEDKIKASESPVGSAPKTEQPAKPQSKKPSGEQLWGNKEQQSVVSDIQKFLMNIVGKEALGPYGADGKWGSKVSSCT